MEDVLPVPAQVIQPVSRVGVELLTQFYSIVIQFVLCTSITFKLGFGHQAGQEVIFRSACTYRESGYRQATSLQIHHVMDTSCSNFAPLIGVTEHCTPNLTQLNSFYPQAITLMNTEISSIVSEAILVKY